MSRTPAERAAQGRRTGKLTGTVRLGHSHRYCQVRLLIRYRQYPTFPTESRVLVIRIDGAQNSTNWDGKIKATVSGAMAPALKSQPRHPPGGAVFDDLYR